jgi:hypothetical protein
MPPLPSRAVAASIAGRRKIGAKMPSCCNVHPCPAAPVPASATKLDAIAERPRPGSSPSGRKLSSSCPIEPRADQPSRPAPAPHRASSPSAARDHMAYAGCSPSLHLPIGLQPAHTKASLPQRVLAVDPAGLPARRAANTSRPSRSRAISRAPASRIAERRWSRRCSRSASSSGDGSSCIALGSSSADLR